MTEVMPQAPSAVSDRSHLYAFLTATDASATALERPVAGVGLAITRSAARPAMS
jgi:hypothetical protein